MTARRRTRQPFVQFSEQVLHLTFTAPWRALLRVAVDGVQPCQLTGEEREAARVLFGPVDEVPEGCRRVLVWRLGRASGKSTVAAALVLWASVTCDLSPTGRGQVPTSFIVSPSKPVAKIALTIAKELVRGTALESMVSDDTSDGFMLRRHDGRIVAVRSVAASKGGANLRGVDVIVLVVDESEFMSSGTETFAVTDSDQIAAAMPRLLEHVLLISTPWPCENATAEFFERNHAHPVDALAALGPSMFMRPTARLASDIDRERHRDAENAQREYDCVAGTRGGSRLFDPADIAAAIVEGRPAVVQVAPDTLVGCGGDLGLERDSSAIAVVAYVGDRVVLTEADEIRPAKGTPLAPGYVVRQRFAPVMQRHGATTIMLDAHYRQSAIEHLEAIGLSFADAPTGAQGKYDSFMHLRSLLRTQMIELPPLASLVSELRSITATPLPGGGTKISAPRRAGAGHADVVSALVLACWSARERRRRAGEQSAQAPDIAIVTTRNLEAELGVLSDGFIDSLSGGGFE